MSATTNVNLNRRGVKNQFAGTALDKTSRAVAPVRIFGKSTVKETSVVGKYTYIGNYSHVINADIGSYCSVARSVEIGAKPHPLHMMSTHIFQYTTEHFSEQPGYAARSLTDPSLGSTEDSQVVIGNDVWIGTKAVVQAGVRIGTGAVIGSSSVVTKDVPPYAVVAGVPARILRYRFDEKTIERLLASQWWHLEPEDMNGVTFDDINAALDEIEKRKQRFARQVSQQLSDTLTNAENNTGNGVLWFDVEKSYSSPAAIEAFKTVDIIESAAEAITVGTHPIVAGLFDPFANMFGIWTGVHAPRLAAGAVTFKLEA